MELPKVNVTEEEFYNRRIGRWKGDALGTYEGRRSWVEESRRVVSGMRIEINEVMYNICQKCKKKNWAKLKRIALGK